MKKDIKSLTLKELQDEMGMIGEAKFRAGQIYRWLHVKYADDFSDMTDLSENLRTKLKENYDIVGVRQVKKLVSKEDNTTKYLFEIENNYIIESVFMRYSYGNTMCVSTQAGCRMGCAFCASTIGGVEKASRLRKCFRRYTRPKRIWERKFPTSCLWEAENLLTITTM